MAKSRKSTAVATLKKEIRKKIGEIRLAMRGATAQQRKRLNLNIKRLDKVSRVLDLLFDDASICNVTNRDQQ
jgi:hypothetical protein